MQPALLFLASIPATCQCGLWWFMYLFFCGHVINVIARYVSVCSPNITEWCADWNLQYSCSRQIPFHPKKILSCAQ